MFDSAEQNGAIRHLRPRIAPPLLSVEDLSLWFGGKQALRHVSMTVPKSGVIALVGASGCGKSSMLKCFSRMHDGLRDMKMTGRIRMAGRDISGDDIDLHRHRRRFGWVGQRPNPFVASVFQNVAYGALVHGVVDGRRDVEDHIERCLRRAMLWDEVKDKLHTANAFDLTIGQQQQLCIARALANAPEVLLMDQPSDALDTCEANVIEAAIRDLGQDHAVIVTIEAVTQARRLSDITAFFDQGELVETGPTADLFLRPADPRTRNFISGALG